MEADNEKQPALSWDEAVALLDANFSFRNRSTNDGVWSYRMEPNGKALVLRESAKGAVVEVPSRFAELLEIASSSSGASFTYQIRTAAELEKVISRFRGSMVVPSSKSNSQNSEHNTVRKSEEAMPSIAATNTILYGPPGTGKTYATASRAVLLCDGKVPETRTEVMARYEQLRNEQRISFVTFHQSFGYEEFVEGLRPHLNESNQVVYSVIPGIFRKACDSARVPQLVKPGLTGVPLEQRSYWKMSLGFSRSQEGTTVFQYCLKNQCVLLGYGNTLDFSDCQDEAEIRAAIESEAPSMEAKESTIGFVDTFKHQLKVGDIVVISSGNSTFRAIAEVTGDYEFVEDAPFHQMRAVKWLAVFEGGREVSEIQDRNFTMRTLYRLNREALNLAGLSTLLSTEVQRPKVRPHVLIIDEINRANISKVFGELITLLEPDKREGELNRIAVRLPYSGEEFTVPQNLHIIGTMNTADRSIALLDTALRRRFNFEELEPDASTLSGNRIQGIDLEKLLVALNGRIEALFDRDHRIGHAFFIGVESIEALDTAFRRKVIPLLQEYFYENWANVRRVLNDYGRPGEFILRDVIEPLPADGDETYTEEPRLTYRVNPKPFPLSAYQRIYAEKN